MTDRGSGFLNFNSLKLNPEITSFSRISSFSVRYFHCRKSLWLFGVLFFILSSVNDAYCQIPWQAGYAYCKKITIKASQIEISGVGSHNNFPVLIDITDNDLRTCSNGGYMENASGYDIRFTTYLGIRLYHDIEGYDPISGRLTAWVRIPSLSKINTDIFLFFGNPSISSNSSSSATWSSNYKAVWHFNNSIANASAFPLVSSDFGSTSTTGKILEGRNFIRTSHQYISVNYNDALDFNDAITVSAWINLVTNDIDQKIFSNQNNISGGYKLGIYTDGKVEFEIRTSDNHPYLNRSAPDGTILSTSTWYYVVGVYSNSEDYIRTYVNGGLDRPMVTDKTAGLTGSGNPAIGRETWNDPSTFDGKFNGIIDELRVQNIARDAGWIKTEFNNQSSPSTFYTVGPTASNPVAVCKPVTLYLDASGNASLTVPMVDNGSSSYCGLVKTLNKYSFSCSNLGENIVTLTVADPFNTVTCNSTVLVRDAIPPVISNCPADISVSADAGSCGARVNWTEPTVSDNCTPTVNIVWIKSKLPGNFFPIGTTQVNYIARDASGNTSTCSFTVTVNDNTMPLINCKVSGQQNVPANTNCKYVHSGTGWDATASDNCTVSSLAYTLTGATSGSGSSLDNVVFNIGLTTVNWEATDAAGNKSQCSFTVNVTDNIIPVVICPPDITHDSDPGMCSYTFTPAQATGTDNCGIDYVTGTRSDGLLLSDPYPVGVTTITWTSTDLNGNTSLPCYQKITVLDKEKPVFTAPPAVTVCRSSDCSFDSNIIPAITGNVFGESDNCTPQALLEIEHSDDLSGITDCNTAGTILRTWKVTDEAGNFTEKVQAIVVEPFPTVTVGNDVSSICTGGNADIVINSSTVNSIPSDFSIDVKVTSTDPGNLSGTAPLADFVLAKSQLPYTINGTLINNSGNPIEVTFRFTPKIAGCNDGSTVSTEVTVHPDPAWGAIVVTPGNICLGGEVTFSAVLNGAAGGSVEWIRSETSGGAGIVVHSPDIPLSPGTYYYRPHYAGGYGGCNLSDGTETMVTVHPDPSWGTLDAPEPDICVGGSVTFSAVLNDAATGTVEWIRSTSPGGTGTVVTSPNTPDTPGTYYYRPHYAGGYGGCNLSDGTETMVTVHPDPSWGTINTPEPDICVGGSVTFSVVLNNAATGTVEWIRSTSPGGTGMVVTSPDTPGSPGTYYYRPVYTGGYGGCNLSDGAETAVTVHPDPSWGTINTPQPDICVGGSVTFSAVLNDAATGTVEWIRSTSPGGTGTVVTSPNTPDTPGTYYYRPHYAGGYGGCNLSDGTETMVTVHPDPSWGTINTPEPDICVGGSVTFSVVLNNAATGTVEWIRSTSPGGTGMVVTSPDTPGSPGTYYYRPVYTGGYGGCNLSDGAETAVTVHPDPSWGTINIPQPDICVGGSVTFSVVLNDAATGTVEWIRSTSPGGTGIVVHSPDIPLSPGTYYYRPVYTGGYGGCNLSDGAETAVTVHPDPSWGTMDAPEPDICVGGSVTFSVVLNNAATGTVEWIRSTSPGGAGTVVTSPDTPGSPGTYYYRPVYVGGYGGCDLSDGPESVVRVIQIPQVNQPSDQVVCNGESVSEINFRTTVSGETVTYSWKNDQVSIGLPENGTGDIRSFIAKNNTRAPLIANIEVTPHITHGSFTCDGPSKTFTITVNPTAQVNIPANQVVCNDAPTQPVIFSTLNNDGLTEYEWTNDQTSIGLAASGTGNIPAFTAVNEGDSPVVATITVSPYYTYDGLKCSGPSVTFTITVDPSAKVVPSVLTQTICNDGKTNIIIGSPSTFSSGVVKFDYTVDATGGVTGFTTPVYGLPKDHVIADELHNPTNEAQTVTYTIVPVTSTGCGSGPAIVIVTVLPTPKVIKPADMDLCPDEDSPPVVLTTPTAGSVYFTWENDNPSIGLASAGEGNIPSFTAINETDNFVTATITIIPHITSDPLVCDGDPVSFTIRVDPKPRIIPVPSPTIQCDNTETNIVLQSPSIFTNGQVSFKYTAVSPDGITGFAPFGTVLSSGDAITDRLVNSSDKPGDVIYTITPVSPVGCSDGPSVTVTVTVEPTPRVLPVPLDTDQCNSTATNIRLESPSEFKNGKVSFRYSVTSTGSVTGISEDMTGLSNGYVIKDRLFNSSDAPQTVTYVIVPVSPGGCGEGASVAVKVTVNPTPRIHPVPENTIRCNNTPANIALLSPSTFTSGSVSINLTATAPEGLTGFTAEETGLPSGYLIPDLLANSTDAPLEVTYTLVPVSGVACDNGPSVSFKVTVNPTPRATPVNLKPAICYDDLTEIILLSPTVMTEGSIKFDYSIFYPDGVTGNNAAGADIPEGETLSFRYRNENDAVTSARFVITPRADALSCPEGANVEEFVELHPKPARGIEILKSFTCESSQGRAALRARISSGADPYRIVWSGPVGYYMEDMEEIDNLYAGNYTLNVTDNLGCMNETSFNIANLSAKPRIIPLPKSTGHHVTCPGGNDGVARIYVREGGTPPFRYWLVYNETETLYSGEFQNIYASDDPSTYLLCTDLKAGSYKLIIRDFNGCELTMDAILTEPPPLIINITPSDYSGSNIDCKGYSTGYAVASVSGGNGGYSYYWYPESGTLPGNNTGSRLDGIPAGKYYVRVTDLSGCEQIESIVLTDPPGMELAGSQVSRSPDGNYGISCYGADDGFIKIDIAGGSGNYDFLWVGPDGFQSRSKDISQLKSGVYTCTVTDINGCILMPEPIFTLTQPDKLEVSLQSSVSSHGGFNIDCHGGTGTVETTVSGGSIGNYSYSWTTTNGSGIIDGEKDQLSLSAGSYHLRVSDLNGCNAEKDINLTEPPEIQLKLVPTHITCQSDTYDNGSVDLTVSGGVAPYNYIWSGGQDTQDIANLTEGVYSVTVTDANGCTKEGSVRINLPPPLTFEKILSAYGNFNISCFGRSDGSIHVNPLSGTPPYSYVWQGPDGFSREGNEISGLKAGEYVLLITDSNYCTGSETVTLIEPPGELTIDITAFEDIRCNGDKSGEISIEAVNNAGAVTYLWSDGVLGNSRQGLAAGRYRVIITDSNNCRTDSVIIFTEPEPLMVELDVTLPTCPDMPDGEIKTRVTGGTDGGYSYLWSDNSTDPDLSNATGGLYSIRVTDMNNCSVEKSLILEAKNPLCLEIPNAISPNGDLVNDVWNIHNKELYPAMEVMIFNRWGEMVWKSERGYPRPWDGRSNGRMLPVDSYHYIIDLNNGTRPVIGHVTIVK